MPWLLRWIEVTCLLTYTTGHKLPLKVASADNRGLDNGVGNVKVKCHLVLAKSNQCWEPKHGFNLLWELSCG